MSVDSVAASWHGVVSKHSGWIPHSVSMFTMSWTATLRRRGRPALSARTHCSTIFGRGDSAVGSD